MQISKNYLVLYLTIFFNLENKNLKLNKTLYMIIYLQYKILVDKSRSWRLILKLLSFKIIISIK